MAAILIDGGPSVISLEDESKKEWRKGRNAKETQNYNKLWETSKPLSLRFPPEQLQGQQKCIQDRSPNNTIAELVAARQVNCMPVVTYVY